MRSATFLGGRSDGLRAAFDGNPPASISIDGEEYRLRAGQPIGYAHQKGCEHFNVPGGPGDTPGLGSVGDGSGCTCSPVPVCTGRAACYVPTKHRAWGGARRFEDSKADFCEAIARGMTVAQAAESVGFGVACVYRHLHNDSAFAESYSAAQHAKRSRSSGAQASTLLMFNVTQEQLAFLEERAFMGGFNGPVELLRATVDMSKHLVDVQPVRMSELERLFAGNGNQH